MQNSEKVSTINFSIIKQSVFFSVEIELTVIILESRKSVCETLWHEFIRFVVFLLSLRSFHNTKARSPFNIIATVDEIFLLLVTYRTETYVDRVYV